MADDQTPRISAFQVEHEAFLADPYGEARELLAMPFSFDILQLRLVRQLAYALTVHTEKPMEETLDEAVSMLMSTAASTSEDEWSRMRQVLLTPLREAAQWGEDHPMTRISLRLHPGVDLMKKVPVTIFRSNRDELVKLGMPVRAAHALSSLPLSQALLESVSSAIAEPYLLDERPEVPEGTLAVAAGFVSEMLKTQFHL